jgi:hypothetical protein
MASGCFDQDEEVQRVLLSKIFPRQAEVLQAEDWKKMLEAETSQRESDSFVCIPWQMEWA